MLTTLCRLLMGSSQTRQNGIEPLRRDFWNDYTYHLLEEVREKSMYYYSRVRRKAWVLIGILAALVIMYLATVTVTFQRPCIIRDGHSCDHPVIRLAKNAQKSFNTTRDAQSQSLDEAVAEYRRRYQMPPPPYFDKWYEFVTERQTMMIDEFHNIYHAILPFWGLAPSTIRARAREDLGRPNVLMEVTIHHGLPIYKNGGQGNFQEDGTIESLRKFA
ncbi:hypothetical protein POX_f07403 [Penicillium oxalicum]|uniref:hypothetical protein n=1 Tax=Penicillium oxalicum TaxID=69781 RepID=UPI0020B64BA2|nr:hypothetical protein POX_f07403 [Penicillium oxalicum]KAI2787048.1 hypothetical protein POX_f07403 [Penicillium oxalicum]